ncbi:tol-pal system protein YbgF [Betaproteobacteria bacterium GR16-43]|nr:tol-pal system protein YbgF [Betaproteobacteria bacterium GR16-43]
MLALAAASIPAKAGLFDDEEARRRIEQIKQELAQQGRDNEARIARLEEQIRNIGVVELLRQIDALNAEIAKLRGSIEVLSNQNDQLQKKQRDFYVDLDSRLARLEGGPAAGAGSAGGSAAPPPTVASASAAPPSRPPTAPTKDDQSREIKAYDAASNLFRRNDFSSAIEAFRAFTKDYPQSPLVPNAEYWIGIGYANLKDYRNALATQEGLLARHPQSPKAPDALLAIAAMQAEQGDNGSARNTLEDIIARYPGSEAAGKARTRLASLRR